MSRICQGCGGLLGRDCYNEYDCVQISQSMQFQNDIGPYSEALIEARNVINWLSENSTVDESLTESFANKIDNVIAVVERLIPTERTQEQIKQDLDDLPF